MYFQEGNKIRLGREHSEETKLKMSLIRIGKPHPHKGRVWSEESKKKLSDKRKGMKFSEETMKRISEGHKGQIPWCAGKKLTEAHKRKLSQYRKGVYIGEKHPNWRGGIAYLPYCPKFNNSLKEKIGIKENGKKLAIHHIHYDKPNCNPDLITLCQKCNSKVNFDRDYYENYFMELLEKRGIICL